jgi:hypothetical protein
LTAAVLLLLPTHALADNLPFAARPNVIIPMPKVTIPLASLPILQVIANSGTITDLNISISATHAWVGDLVLP